jgi:hypothetical protein
MTTSFMPSTVMMRPEDPTTIPVESWGCTFGRVTHNNHIRCGSVISRSRQGRKISHVLPSKAPGHDQELSCSRCWLGDGVVKSYGRQCIPRTLKILARG